MTKARPVLVLARNANRRLVTVVPLSSTPPNIATLTCHKLSINPIPGKTGDAWAKCDMVITVSLARLNRHYTRSAGTKGRQFHTIAVSDQDFEAICTAVRHALHLN